MKIPSEISQPLLIISWWHCKNLSLSKSENTIIKGQQEKYVVIKKLKFHGSNVDPGFKGMVFLDKVLTRKKKNAPWWLV